jgi:hypothetical protein
MTAEWQRAWVAALDELEMDVEATATLLDGEHRARELPAAQSWRPPVGLGPLPAPLRGRAEAILARQMDVAEQISRTIAVNRRQSAFAAKLETGDAGAARPAYVDTAI